MVLLVGIQILDSLDLWVFKMHLNSRINPQNYNQEILVVKKLSTRHESGMIQY